jgi:hypothetical protein
MGGKEEKYTKVLIEYPYIKMDFGETVCEGCDLDFNLFKIGFNGELL